MARYEELMSIVANLSAIIGGAVLLSLEFGWKAGVGVALIVYFHKEN